MIRPAEFDYVVVGAGAAGCVVAARLSEDPDVRVALVEAGGPDDHPDIKVPLAAPALFGSEYDWAYTTCAQPGLGGRSLGWPRGRVLGGSSSLNFQMWVPGHAEDFRSWQAVSAEWGWSVVEPFLRRAEDWTGDAAGRGGFGVGGPLCVSPQRDPDPSTLRFLDACDEVGLKAIPGGLSAADNSGSALTPVNQRDGARFSVADGYLRPALGRPNLTVITGEQVHGIDIDDTGRATGVRLAGRSIVADLEVVLCAGTVGSAQLLMLSGVGPVDVLRRAGVRPRLDLPGVGQGLRDHLLLDLAVYASGPHRFLDLADPQVQHQYEQERLGPLTSNIAEAVAFWRSDGQPGPPDIELMWSPMAFAADGASLPGRTLSVVLLQPASTGEITLVDGDPLRAPQIDPGYLRADSDVHTFIAGIQLARRLLDTEALAPMVLAPVSPWPEHPGGELENFLRSSVETVFHPVGTCRMGRPEDPMAVVDGTLRVRGVDRLRVVDASVAPAVPRGHTNALAVVVGERGADLIRSERKQ